MDLWKYMAPLHSSIPVYFHGDSAAAEVHVRALNGEPFPKVSLFKGRFFCFLQISSLQHATNATYKPEL